MKFQVGDQVALNGDDRLLVVVAQLDAKLIWVHLVNSADALYAFRVQDLRLVRAAQAASPQLTLIGEASVGTTRKAHYA